MYVGSGVSILYAVKKPDGVTCVTRQVNPALVISVGYNLTKHVQINHLQYTLFNYFINISEIIIFYFVIKFPG